MWDTNPEMADRFDPSTFAAVALDESSILKNFTGATRNALIKQWRNTKYRSTWSATPAPNDVTELCNQAEFVGAMPRNEMLAAYFVHDDDGWRLKGHAAGPMFKWMSTWATTIRKPSDIGGDDSGYILPPLHVIPQIIDFDHEQDGQLFATDLGGVGGRHAVRKATLTERCERAVMLASEPGQWIVWCGLNDEARLIAAAVPGAVNVEGSQTPEQKAEAFEAFQDGAIRVLVSKPSIAGMGMNFQQCHQMVFLGLSDCYDEQTEVLTRGGWKSFGKVSLDDDLATVNPDTQAFEWQAPSRVVWEPYSGPMLHFQGQRNFDLLVTPNHRLYVQRCPTRYPSETGEWELKYAGEMAARYRRQEYRMLSVPSSSDGERPEWVAIPPYGRLSSRSRTVERIPIEDFLRLAAWYITEGYCRPIDSPEAGRIAICQADMHPENRAEIIDLMTRIGLNVNSRTWNITGYSINLAAYLMDQFGDGSYVKRIPRWIKDLHPDLLTILRDTMMKGDGAATGKYYKSFSERLRDDFQEICLRTGIRASIHNNYVTLARRNLRPAIHTEPELVEYDGMIGCATVPNHTLIVRRNGIAVVSGNSWESYYQAIRRCWRFGQMSPVDAHLVVSPLETQIIANVRAKEHQVSAWTSRLVAYTQETYKNEPVPALR